jgi:hypothetical protein
MSCPPAAADPGVIAHVGSSGFIRVAGGPGSTRARPMPPKRPSRNRSRTCIGVEDRADESRGRGRGDGEPASGRRRDEPRRRRRAGRATPACSAQTSRAPPRRRCRQGPWRHSAPGAGTRTTAPWTCPSSACPRLPATGRRATARSRDGHRPTRTPRRSGRHRGRRSPPGSPSRPTEARLAAPGPGGPRSEPMRAACRSRPAAAERE